MAWLVTSGDAKVICHAKATAQAQAFELCKGGYTVDIYPLVTASDYDALRSEVSRLRDRASECEQVLALILGGMLSGAVKCKPMMTKRDGDYVVGSLQELVENTLTNLDPTP